MQPRLISRSLRYRPSLSSCNAYFRLLNTPRARHFELHLLNSPAVVCGSAKITSKYPKYFARHLDVYANNCQLTCATRLAK